MEISKINLSKLRNAAHFQLHTEFKDFITKQGAKTLKVAKQFENYLALYAKVDDGFKKIEKSLITSKIEDADKARDEIWSGMVSINRGATKHFDPAIAEAAERLKIVFDTYGNLATLPFNEQTSLTNNILQELEGKYAVEAKLVGIKGFVNELKVRNSAFDSLMKERYEESSVKSTASFKEERANLDKAYLVIVKRINSFAVVEDDVLPFETFIKTFNGVIDKFELTLNKKPRSKPQETENTP